jgi:ATP-dependent 26S proteasome regulatory subunit
LPSQAELLDEAKKVIKEQSDILERLGKAAQPIGLFLMKVPPKKAILLMNNSTILVEDPGNIKPGQLVTTVPDTGQIISATEMPLHFGDVVVVANVRDDGTIEVGINGQQHLVLPGVFTGLKAGDKVLLDGGKAIVVEVVERIKPPQPKLAEPVKWSDIGGNEEAKALLQEAIEWPRQYPKLFESYKAKPAAGVLLWGEPGCGKTMLGKAVATSIAKGKAGGFINIKGPEILDPYVGVSEALVRDTFRKAREYYDENGTEAVVFVDEADALLTKRGQHGNYMGQTIVPAFLTEMDGLESSPAIVILSTNRPDTLDPAIIRDGRIDYKVGVRRPSQKEAKTIIDIHLRKTKVAHEDCASVAADKLYDGQNVKLPHSGALLAGVVSKAKSIAMRRDVSNGGRVTGIRRDDILMAVDVVSRQELQATAQ